MTLVSLRFWIVAEVLIIQDLFSADACGYPGSAVHTSIEFSREFIEPGTLATYGCDAGFELLGPVRRRCAENGSWVPMATPFCVLNVAVGKASLQSSVDGNGTPQKALDGRTSSFYNPETCTMTKMEAVPWWYVNLLEPYLVQLVRIDFGMPCCSNNRPATIVIRVGNNRPDFSPNPICNRFNGFIEEGRPLYLPCDTVTPGAFVSIHLEGSPNNPLSICEAFVYTDQALPVERCPQFRDQPPGSGATYNGKCYIFYSNQPRTFQSAKRFCESRESTLVDESNPALQGFLSWELYRRHRNDPGGQYWMGAIRDPKDTHNWKWINGQDITVSYWSMPRGRENCSRFDGGKKWLWSETNCILNLNYICVHGPSSCGTPGIPANSSVVIRNLNIASSIEYHCSAGHVLVGPTVRTCQPTGSFSEFPPQCRYLECGHPAYVPNGNYTLLNGTTNYLSMVHYYCNKGFLLVGRSNLVCDVDEKWNGPPPMCDPIICRSPPPLNHGWINSSIQATTYGAAVEYECDDGYKMVGDAILICGDSGDWEGKIPTCYVQPGVFDGNRRSHSKSHKRSSLFSNRLNMGGIIALGVFGGFVFLAVAITIIVIIVRRVGNRSRHFGGSMDSTTVTTYDGGGITNNFTALPHHVPYHRVWDEMKHSQKYPKPSTSQHQQHEAVDNSNTSATYRQETSSQGRYRPRDRRHSTERYNKSREEELNDESQISQQIEHRRSDKTKASDAKKYSNRYLRNDENWYPRHQQSTRCKHGY